MSREKKFHQLIEDQNKEEKELVWAKIQKKLAEDASNTSMDVAPRRIWRIPWKRLVATGAAIAILAVSVVASLKLLPQGDITGDNSSSGNDSQNDNRYCTSEEYTSNQTNKTIAQYAQEKGQNILYFNWYDTTEEVTDFVYTLNDTQDVICYRENIMNPETGDMLTLYVIDKNVDLDFLIGSGSANEQIDTYNQVDITWSFDELKADASFEYGDYKYTIVLVEPLEEDDILEYVKLLLS
jgi:hypothetical protein